MNKQSPLLPFDPGAAGPWPYGHCEVEDEETGHRQRMAVGIFLFLSSTGALLLALSLAGVEARASAAPAPDTGKSGERNVSIQDYRQHLADLAGLVRQCSKARDGKACDPALVGADDSVALGAGRRMVRYGWLRALLTAAQKKDSGNDAAPEPRAPTGDEPAEPSTAELLKSAEARLQQDLAQTNVARPAPDAHPLERQTMAQVLAERAFRGLRDLTARDAALERFAAWLNLIFASAARLASRAAWVGRAAVWGFILAVCVGLAWALLQMERRWRVRLTPDDVAPAPGSPSARAWQLWLNDSHEAAAGGRWREAIHSAYWAAISRLESRRLWPADRARTPREYLALLAADDPRRTGLAALTGSFESIWYGGRAAAESDYRQAEEMADELIRKEQAN